MAEQLVNVHDLVGRCPFATSQKLLAGKWSLLIMHELSEGPVRFRELERRLHPITQATLTRARWPHLRNASGISYPFSLNSIRILYYT